MRGLAVIIFFLISFAAQAQKPVFTSDSLCYFAVPSVLTSNCANIDCSFRVSLNCKVPPDQLLATASIKIFNRWGQEIYSMDIKDQQGWDGGEEKEGTYFWILTYYEYPSGVKTKKTVTGNLTITR